MLPAKDMERKYHLPFRFFEKFFLNQYKYLGTVTQSLETKLKKINPKAKTFTIHNGIDSVVSVDEKSKFKQDCIFFLGRIEVNQKGLDLLLKALKNVSNPKNYKLIIAGSGLKSEITKLNRMVSEFGLGDRVEFIGRVGSEQKHEFFKRSIALVAPSRFETFGIGALEALSYGVPVITYEIDGFSWMPKNTCLKAKPYDVDSLTTKIQTIIDDASLRDSMSMSCLESAKDFTWDSSFSKFNTMLLEVLFDSNSGESSSTSLHYGSH